MPCSSDFLSSDSSSTEISTLSLHDALPILKGHAVSAHIPEDATPYFEACLPIEELARRGRDTLRFGPMKPMGLTDPDRKSTRLNSSHTVISYAVFCLKKKRSRQRLSATPMP